MSTSSSLTKICSICGQLKPLSAFLQFSDNKTEYGAICSDCRKAGASDATIDKEDETKVTTGAVLDSKTKVHSDTEKKQEHDRTEESYHEDRDEKEQQTILDTEKTQDIVKKETQHRQSYLDRPRFLSTQKQTSGPSESRWAQQKNAERVFGIEQTAQQDETTREEQKKTEIDLTAPVEDTRVEGKIKYSGDSFKRFTALVKKGSPIGTAFEQSKPERPEETPSEFVEKNWGPRTRK